MRARVPAITPRRFVTIAYVALAALTAIVLTGAAVRLTDSGLGCPDWPRCYGKAVPPLSLHSVIEYGNRVFSASIGIVVVGAWIAAFLRTPRRRDLTVVATLLPLGVVGQAVLGGFTVKHELAPGYVMAHFGLSMLILIAAVALVFRARAPDPPAAAPPRSHDRATVWLVRFLAVLGAVVLFVGTAATASGPHAGGSDGELIHRLDFKGPGHTLVWVIHRHATLAATLGLGVILAWFLAKRRAEQRELADTLMVAGILMAAQGLIGTVQYELALPADIVWVHVTMATVTWIALLWCVGVAGRLAPRAERRLPSAPSGARAAVEDELLRTPEPAARR
ncbi:MAG TPA: COX15/CtaA family protein [Conexibacter sp.]|nr:COX15/CtaA family protein [Conexibacter sp.]